MNTKQMGTIAELKAQYDFMNYGYNILIPQGDYCAYDLVIEKEGRFWKVQVKSAQKIKEGKIEFDLTSQNYYCSKKYSIKDCELFYLYCHENQQSYLYFNENDKNTRSITLRLTLPKNNQRKGIHLAEDYLFDKKIYNIPV